MKGGKKIYELTKLYSETGFPDDDQSLGYPINVYQETINKVFREYLVNFDYFIQIMEDYGFVLIDKEEAKTKQMPNGTGLFSELYTNMQTETQSNYRLKNEYGDALNMSEEERRISFMNRYFIFKKIRTVNTDKLKKILTEYSNVLDRLDNQYDDAHDATQLSKQLVKKDIQMENKVEEQKKPKLVKKIKRKFTIKDYSPIKDTTEEEEKKKETEMVEIKEIIPEGLEPQIRMTGEVVKMKKKPNIKIMS